MIDHVVAHNDMIDHLERRAAIDAAINKTKNELGQSELEEDAAKKVKEAQEKADAQVKAAEDKAQKAIEAAQQEVKEAKEKAEAMK
jgi:chromosome segregation ATPase